MKIQSVATSKAPQAIGPYSQAVQAGDLLWCSGQIGLDPETGEFVEGGVEAQARQVLRNLEAVLQAGGSSMDRVLRTTVFLQDLADFAKVNAIYAEAFGAHKPARACVEAAALPKGALVEIDCVAALG
ncbi:MAG TPA: RidA family protein [Planctomycetes bacterium]|nr:RidA family protein [Planctomycetota bacterium]